MNRGVKAFALPRRYRVAQSIDDAAVKAEALRLGLLPKLTAELAKRAGQRCAAAVVKDGDRAVAIFAWAGFASATDNGWSSIAVSPVCRETVDWLITVARKVSGASGIGFLKGGAPWQN